MSGVRIESVKMRVEQTGRVFCAVLLILMLMALPLMKYQRLVSLVVTAENRNPERASHQPAILSENTSVFVKRSVHPQISFSDGHELITSYSGPEVLTQALENDLAEPLALTSA